MFFDYYTKKYLIYKLVFILVYFWFLDKLFSDERRDCHASISFARNDKQSVILNVSEGPREKNGRLW